MNEWKEIIEFLKSEECSMIHKFYSSVDGWANLAYKGSRYHITDKWSLERVQKLIQVMKIKDHYTDLNDIE